MLILNTFGPNFGEPDASPFCVKVMCLLTMSKARWRVQANSDSRKAPYQKLPVLIDGDQTIADSDFIRTHLEQSLGVDFDEGLTESQRARSRALIRMAEEHLYFCLVYDRWVIEQNWQVVEERFFSVLPLPLRWFVPAMVRRGVIAGLRGQGIGRLGVAEVADRARQDVISIEQSLGSEPFLFGDTATAADASVAAVLAAIAGSPTATTLQQLVVGNTRLMQYLQQVKQAIYPPQA